MLILCVHEKCVKMYFGKEILVRNLFFIYCKDQLFMTELACAVCFTVYAFQPALCISLFMSQYGYILLFSPDQIIDYFYRSGKVKLKLSNVTVWLHYRPYCQSISTWGRPIDGVVFNWDPIENISICWCIPFTREKTQ